MFNIINSSSQSAYIAASYIKTDGPFQASQDFTRLNLFGKYSAMFKNMDRLSFSALHFNSRWDASGQIPQRAVDAGMIGRFGAIDPNEGGETDRTNLNKNTTSTSAPTPRSEQMPITADIISSSIPTSPFFSTTRSTATRSGRKIRGTFSGLNQSFTKNIIFRDQI